MDGSRKVKLFGALARDFATKSSEGYPSICTVSSARPKISISSWILSPANVERLKVTLRAVFADPEIDQISAADLAGEYPAIEPAAGD